ncbi:MAG: nitrogen fixation protein NifW [Epsilonproteobacteria bacterium]|nr:nitrogen fixation protein NifW [Campylobacterota bacterium]
MKTLEEFYALRSAEEYFDFFGIAYEKHVVETKRLHIMRAYGLLLHKGFERFDGDETYLMDFCKFALIKVYKEYEKGHIPSAAEVWGMLENGKAKGCLACAISLQGGSCGC